MLLSSSGGRLAQRLSDTPAFRVQFAADEAMLCALLPRAQLNVPQQRLKAVMPLIYWERLDFLCGTSNNRRAQQDSPTLGMRRAKSMLSSGPLCWVYAAWCIIESVASNIKSA